MPQVQLSDVETKFQTLASQAIGSLDAKTLHALADELDKIESAMAGINQIEVDLEAMQAEGKPEATAQ